MQVSQIYNLVNTAAQGVQGEITLPTEDLSNLVDVGTSIANALGYDSFYKALVNRIGKMYFVDRPYKGQLPKLFKDAWEFGSIVAKAQVDDMQVTQNDSWQIVNGASYDPWVVNLPVVSSKFYNKMATFELDITTAEEQIKQSFTSVDEMNRFLSMIQTMVYNTMEIRIEALAFRALDNLIAVTINDNNSARVIHLLTEYNSIFGTSLTAGQALGNADFLRWSSRIMGLLKKRMASRTAVYNIGGKLRHTPADRLHVVVLADFAEAQKYGNYAVTYNKEFVELPNYEEVAFWQGIGTSFAYADTSKIDVVAVEDDGTTASVSEDNIVAVMFDDYACGILQPRKRVTTIYNPKIEAYNDFHKYESRFFNDFQENAVVLLLD